MWTPSKVKMFVRAIVAEIGLDRAAFACGVSPQMVSYWQVETKPDRIPVWHLFTLDALTEHHPLLNELASESGYRLEQMSAPLCRGASPIEDFGISCKELGEFQHALAAAIEAKTPTNIRIAQTESFEAIDSIRNVVSDLSGAPA
jgi:hypothetical protein